MMQGMVINMEEAKLRTLAQIKEFLDGTTEVAFREPKAERNTFIERVKGVQNSVSTCKPLTHYRFCFASFCARSHLPAQHAPSEGPVTL